jgi:hypothetical protein
MGGDYYDRDVAQPSYSQVEQSYTSSVSNSEETLIIGTQTQVHSSLTNHIKS